MGPYNYYRDAVLTQLPKRKVFISFSQTDRSQVDQFVAKWAYVENVFIPRAVGLSFGNDLINSKDADYVISRIRQGYLGDSTVTIVLLGTCTHSRRFVDWELKASLRSGDVLTPNGLLGILLPSAGAAAHLPPRFEANWNPTEVLCYARYRPLPNSAELLRSWIEDAYDARTSRNQFIVNYAEMMKYNAVCKHCGITHPA